MSDAINSLIGSRFFVGEANKNPQTRLKKDIMSGHSDNCHPGWVRFHSHRWISFTQEGPNAPTVCRFLVPTLASNRTVCRNPWSRPWSPSVEENTDVFVFLRFLSDLRNRAL